MADLILYILVFVAVMIVGGIFIFWKRRQTKKKAAEVSVTLFQRTATGLRVINAIGTETVENTQKMLDIALINRKFNFPSPTTQIFGTYMYLQTDEITWRQLILRTDLPISIQLEKISSKLNKDEVLTKEQKKDLMDYLKAEKLKPEIDPAFRHIYANNVEKIVKATTLEDDSIWAKISKLMPVIMIVATCLGLAILMYAYVPLFNAAIGHVTLTCTNSAAASNVSQLTTTVPPTAPTI